MAETPRRSTVTSTETHVSHTAKPLGRSRENPPHLGDLRAFVAACEGLPDDLSVYINNGSLDEGGRRNITFFVRHRVTDGTEEAEPVDV
jgi:hypothetical protein